MFVLPGVPPGVFLPVQYMYCCTTIDKIKKDFTLGTGRLRHRSRFFATSELRVSHVHLDVHMLAQFGASRMLNDVVDPTRKTARRPRPHWFMDSMT